MSPTRDVTLGDGWGHSCKNGEISWKVHRHSWAWTECQALYKGCMAAVKEERAVIRGSRRLHCLAGVPDWARWQPPCLPPSLRHQLAWAQALLLITPSFAPTPWKKGSPKGLDPQRPPQLNSQEYHLGKFHEGREDTKTSKPELVQSFARWIQTCGGIHRLIYPWFGSMCEPSQHLTNIRHLRKILALFHCQWRNSF